MTLQITTIVGPPIETNAYLLVDGADALVVDVPWQTADVLVETAREAGATIRQIVLTHAHWDHIGDATRLQQLTGAELLAHQDAQERLGHPATSMGDLPFVIPPVRPTRWIGEGDTLEVGSHPFQVMHLPGHDPAHIALYSPAESVLFDGDVAFPNGHGRIDIPGADEEAMVTSIARLAQMPDAVRFYPGHGKSSTIGAERDWMDWFRERAVRRQAGS